VHPVEHRLVGRLFIADSVRREYCWRDIFHETKVSILTTNKWLRHVESSEDLNLFPSVEAQKSTNIESGLRKNSARH
jgi:hypothetical protein